MDRISFWLNLLRARRALGEVVHATAILTSVSTDVSKMTGGIFSDVGRPSYCRKCKTFTVAGFKMSLWFVAWRR
jgi:hypothetical protein